MVKIPCFLTESFTRTLDWGHQIIHGMQYCSSEDRGHQVRQGEEVYTWSHNAHQRVGIVKNLKKTRSSDHLPTIFWRVQSMVLCNSVLWHMSESSVKNRVTILCDGRMKICSKSFYGGGLVSAAKDSMVSNSWQQLDTPSLIRWRILRAIGSSSVHYFCNFSSIWSKCWRPKKWIGIATHWRYTPIHRRA